jgi:hypothetical protein
MISPSEGTFKALIASTTKAAAAGRTGLGAKETAAMAAATGTAAAGVADTMLAGDYAKAATLYRAALAKGAVDPNLVNTRLGIALASAGQKAEAEAALRAVTGPRAEIAALWLALLSRRA